MVENRLPSVASTGKVPKVASLTSGTIVPDSRGFKKSGALVGAGNYSKEELAALQGIFSLYDTENSGRIRVEGLESILQKIGHDPEHTEGIIAAAREQTQDGSIRFAGESHQCRCPPPERGVANRNLALLQL